MGRWDASGCRAGSTLLKARTKGCNESVESGKMSVEGGIGALRRRSVR